MATMGYKHVALDRGPVLAALSEPNFGLKIIPHVDGSPRICELVRYRLEDIRVKEAWSAPAQLQLFNHVIADVARLPVREVLSGQHLIADLTLGYGEVAFDYLARDAQLALAA
jgi:acetoacetate decarboxylase